MKSYWKINVVICLLLLAMSYYYFSYLAVNVPDNYALIVNIVSIPFLFGMLGGVCLRGRLFERILYVLPIPIITVILLVGDPYYPGLKYILTGPLLLFFVTGVGAGYLLIHQAVRLLRRC